MIKIVLLFLYFVLPVLCIAQQKSSQFIYFDFDKSELSAPEAEKLTNYFNTFSDKEIIEIIVEGHTDENGSSTYNNKLSEKRAQAVIEILRSIAADIQYTQYAHGKTQLLTTDEQQGQLNRRVRVSVFYNDIPEIVKPVIELIPYLQEVNTQLFSIDLSDTIIVKGEQGTTIKISPGSLQKRHGELAIGQAQLQLREYYQPNDIMFSGLNTLSGDSLLETGGMFSVFITQGSDTLSDRVLKPVSIRMPVVRQPSGEMNVFIRNDVDTTNWNNTGDLFQRTKPEWKFPGGGVKLTNWHPRDDYNYGLWRKGFKYKYDPWVSQSLLLFLKGNRLMTKRYKQTIEKVDSVTLLVNLNMTYKRRGVKKLGIKNFDTTFFVRYQAEEYFGYSLGLNWINCDRFLDFKNVTDYYVTTPAYKGAHVMLYFKRLNAFMRAEKKEDGSYVIGRIPPNEEVWVVAVGKKEDAFYFAKSEIVTTNNGTTTINIKEITEADLLKEMKSFSL